MRDKKEKFLAILLALVAGVYGVHWFYLQDNDRAIKYLVTSIVGILTSWLIIGLLPLLVVPILVLIDVFKFAFMSDDEFDVLYNPQSETH